jgi:hypothetical protein
MSLHCTSLPHFLPSGPGLAPALSPCLPARAKKIRDEKVFESGSSAEICSRTAEKCSGRRWV